MPSALSPRAVLGYWPWAAFAAFAAVVARPLALGPLLVPTTLRAGEVLFVMWGGLKGAVPILLAAFAVLGDAPDAPRIYGIVFVVVACSVLVQGATIPLAAGRLVVPAPRVRAPAEARA